MGFDKRKYIYIAVAALVAVVTVYVIYSLVRYGNLTEKSQNEYLIEANRLHNDSLYEAAVEPYMKAAGFDKQQSLVNYNSATNTIMKNYPQLSKVFNEDGYKLEDEVGMALHEATKRLAVAGELQPDTAKYSTVYHNMGVTDHMRGELEKAAEAYKEALRKNPADEDARYNLAVILHQMKNNQNQQDQQQQQDEQQEQEEKQEQEQQQQENKEQEQQDKEEQQEQNQQQQQQNAGEEQDDKEKMEQMLKALLQDEKEIREKMEELEKAKVNSRSIEKNW